ncbi:MAG: PAAR domain-containing protein [Gammaproteobacteria bacterium]
MSKKPAARMGDVDTGHHPFPPTPIITGNASVLIEGMPAACLGDQLAPHHPGTRQILSGAPNVSIGGKPAARVGEAINCGGIIATGASRVVIGNDPPPPARASQLSQGSWPFSDKGKPLFYQSPNQEPTEPAKTEPAKKATSVPEQSMPPSKTAARTPPSSASPATHTTPAKRVSKTVPQTTLFTQSLESNEPDKKHWVHVTVFDAEGQALANEKCRIDTPDGCTHVLSTDQRGRVRLNGVTQEGLCRIRFFGKAFLKDGTQPPVVAGEASTPYVVKQGDTLLRIALSHGLNSVKALYHHPDNADFRALRPNPNLIFPGDQLAIPPTDCTHFEVSLNAHHHFALPPPDKERFQLNLLSSTPAEGGIDLAGKRAVLTIGSQVIDTRLDHSGQLEAELDQHNETEARIELYLSDDPTAPPEVFTCLLAHLDPIDSLSGVQARCNQLGFDCGTVDGIMGKKTRSGIMAFQRAHGLNVDGEFGPKTENKLVEIYGC